MTDRPNATETHDAITNKEIAGTEPGNQARPAIEPASSKRPNAFTELMTQSKKPKPPIIPTADGPGTTQKAAKTAKRWDGRNGLGVYIESPETNPENKVLEYDDDFVVITDKYPKASVHLLLIPRKKVYYDQHPLHALSTDPAFLAEVRKRIIHLRELAAYELRRQYGDFSASDKPYNEAFEAMMSSPDPPPPPEERAVLLPSGRDWSKDIVVGVHTHPSMNHLHIHIFSRDMHSDWMKHKKHYLSFNSGFLVQLGEFPLEEDSKRFHPGDWPSWDMKCWRCGENFKNKFAALKQHLNEEFEEWRKE
ncbi:HIT-like domain-containing protein [Alternaria rosae]|uniref:HIT-like domain-containing protein n=1 Tax=Alternaria rosae TaxID=1187941 RepID=UPI001E8EACB7|nr:HIT-like domain-containing protein [Alternaria rosae]KAH6875816.1 HIT-like domain-containing protein [Alternaria rosae]